MACSDPESFAVGANFEFFFLGFFWGGGGGGLSWWDERGSTYHYKQVIIGPPVKHHLNGVSLACRWWPNIECWLGSFVIVQGIGNSIAKKPYIFVIDTEQLMLLLG